MLKTVVVLLAVFSLFQVLATSFASDLAAGRRWLPGGGIWQPRARSSHGGLAPSGMLPLVGRGGPAGRALKSAGYGGPGWLSTARPSLCPLCASGRHRAQADRSGHLVARMAAAFGAAASGQEVRSVVARESWDHEFHAPDLSTAAQAAKKSAFDAENPFCCSHSRMAISVARQVSTVSGYSTPMVASRSRIVL